MISDAKNRMLTPAEWLKDAGDSFRNKHLSEVYARYEEGLRGNNALDFDDLLLKTLELLASQPPVLSYYRDRFDYILVDEYQDTNAAQYELVRLLAGEKRNLCVVGDDDQSIYGWRGADIRNILDFEKDFPDAKVVKLEQNYRSTANILDAANQVIAHNRGRKEKALWTEAGEGEKITLYRALDERDEAAYIAAMARREAQRVRRGAGGGALPHQRPVARAGRGVRALGHSLPRLRRAEVLRPQGGQGPHRLHARAGQPGRRHFHPPHHQRAKARHWRQHRGGAAGIRPRKRVFRCSAPRWTWTMCRSPRARLRRCAALPR